MSDSTSRRSFLQSVGLGAAAFGSGVPNLFGQDKAAKPIRFAVIGTGGRGTGLMRALLNFPGVEVVAMCDINEKHLNRAIEIVKRVKGNTPAGYSKDEYDYRNMLKRKDCDGVLVATPQKWHARMSVDCMKAGKSVGCEVPAGWTVDEMLELVATKEETGKRYMLLENYVYMRRHMAILSMVQKGLFGEPYYGLCSYIHRTPSLYFKPDGTLAWRGLTYLQAYGNIYPTHALGPVSKWFGINDGDRFEYCTSMMTEPPRMMHKYAVERCGPESEAAKAKFIAGEFVPTMIKTAKGSVIQVNFDGQSPRHADNYYLLQGTNGIYDSRRNIYIESGPQKGDHPNGYAEEEHENEIWKRHFEEAEKSGHGGGDYFVMSDLCEMVRQDREPWIDVYDAAAWSAIIGCSKMSIDRKGMPTEIPDFTNGRWEDASWRKDSMKPV